MTSPEAYDRHVETIRQTDYPTLHNCLYLDAAGQPPLPARLVHRYSSILSTSLFGNPHSASPSSLASTQMLEDARARILKLVRADSDSWEVVFTANATAGAKIVGEALREHSRGNTKGFSYIYHRDNHTSLVGMRELSGSSKCLWGDSSVEEWLQEAEAGFPSKRAESLALLAYPAQSNFNGRRLPLNWCERVYNLRRKHTDEIHTLLDASSLLSSHPMDLTNSPASHASFIVFSLYKIFGLPDLGVLLVNKHAAHLFHQRRYFGGGTVDMVIMPKNLEIQPDSGYMEWKSSLAERLEEGTPPIHSLAAIAPALNTHAELFGSLVQVSAHTARLRDKLVNELTKLRHGNDVSVVHIYASEPSHGGYGPIVAMNLRTAEGKWVEPSHVEKMASVTNIHLRTGGVCNPGGMADSLGLEEQDIKDNYQAGVRCGDAGVRNGKPTGVVRVSLGAWSTIQDVEGFLNFVNRYFVRKAVERPRLVLGALPKEDGCAWYVDSLTVYPIKSCAGFKVPLGMSWEIRREGLAWDREWCLLHAATGQALSMKRYPRMALIKPILDLEQGLLRVQAPDGEEITVPLENPSRPSEDGLGFSLREAKVCGDKVTAKRYREQRLEEFFTKAVGVPCQLARLPASSVPSSPPARASKLARRGNSVNADMPGGFPSEDDEQGLIDTQSAVRPLLLSNESPILAISQSSLNAVNRAIESTGGEPVSGDVFRANILIAESGPVYLTPISSSYAKSSASSAASISSVTSSRTSSSSIDSTTERVGPLAPTHTSTSEHPWVEETWTSISIDSSLAAEDEYANLVELDVLGACQRCQMICVDPVKGVRREGGEPFATLARMKKGLQVGSGRSGVWFGIHLGLTEGRGTKFVRVGDWVRATSN